ncbi:MerR family transcriptional regulator [Levilactobacillus huananensis]|uniref:MerR family transcriptional regulator n=1 Tax=Levilactobacillus huananensis TaxID=2486019 RepID=UPI000F768C5B|nr:MerR family transcriptional regulator [Levilactobacillus huananensis]
MSDYSTGELAKLGHVSVRTLQYYDQKGLLPPTAVTAGGRRRYAETDLQRLKLIRLLKGMDLSLAAIQEILDSDQANRVLADALTQQEHQLLAEQAENTEKLRTLRLIQRSLPDFTDVSIQSITDMEHMMANKQGLRRVRLRLFGFGGILGIIEWGTFIYALFTGNWWFFVIGMVIVIAGASWISWDYLRSVSYACPNCGTVFNPAFKEAFFARHNIRARKVTCPHCGQKNFCVEVYREKAKAN